MERLKANKPETSWQPAVPKGQAVWWFLSKPRWEFGRAGSLPLSPRNLVSVRARTPKLQHSMLYPSAYTRLGKGPA